PPDRRTVGRGDPRPSGGAHHGPASGPGSKGRPIATLLRNFPGGESDLDMPTGHVGRDEGSRSGARLGTEPTASGSTSARPAAGPGSGRAPDRAWTGSRVASGGSSR